jgi:hypothetical protein
MNLDRLRDKQRDLSAKAQTQDLRQGRPPKPEPAGFSGSYCERCGGPSWDIQCLYLGYWLCKACADFHRGVAAYAERVKQFRYSG